MTSTQAAQTAYNRLIGREVGRGSQLVRSDYLGDTHASPTSITKRTPIAGRLTLSGLAYFRNKKDATVKRGAVMMSLVLLGLGLG